MVWSQEITSSGLPLLAREREWTTGLTCLGKAAPEAGDGSPRYDPAGLNAFLGARRLLEEGAPVAEAERLARRLRWSSRGLFALADRTDAVVLEVTPKGVAARRPRAGVLAC